MRYGRYSRTATQSRALDTNGRTAITSDKERTTDTAVRTVPQTCATPRAPAAVATGAHDQAEPVHAEDMAILSTPPDLVVIRITWYPHLTSRRLLMRPCRGPAASSRKPSTALASPPTFARLLKRYRLAAGLTQEELAERANLSVRAISDLERGVKLAPRRDTVALLLGALELSAEDRGTLEDSVRRRRGPPLPARS